SISRRAVSRGVLPNGFVRSHSRPDSSISSGYARSASLRSAFTSRMLRRVPGTGRWEIRPLAEGEVERVAAVLGLARLESAGNGFYLVAWEGSEPVGHAHLALTDPPELQDVEVRVDYRRRGAAPLSTE